MNTLGIALLMATTAIAGAQGTVMLDRGHDVELKFMERITSNNAREGDMVRMQVAKNVFANGILLIPAGTPVTAIVENVDKHGRFGKNARMEFSLQPINLNGQMIPLQNRQKGLMFQGGGTGKAAAASVGGAVLLGPLGLLAGYGVVGEPVVINIGTKIETEVEQPVAITLFPPVARR